MMTCVFSTLEFPMPDLSRRSFISRAALGAAALPFLALEARAAAHSTTHQVAIRGMAFVPAALSIAAGDTVVFTNEDNAPHTATSDSGVFDTPRLSRGQTAQLTFPGAGTFAYHCAVHPNMKGTITVA